MKKNFDYLNYIKDNPLLKEDSTMEPANSEIRSLFGFVDNKGRPDSCIKVNTKRGEGEAEGKVTFIITILQSSDCPENYIDKTYSLNNLVKKARETKIVQSLMKDKPAFVSDAKPNNGGGITWVLKYKIN